MLVRNDRVYVTDQRAFSVQAFERTTGRLVATAGREGEGPGDFIFVDWIGDCGSDTIFVSDVGVNRVSVFSLDLDLMRTVTWDYERIRSFQCVGPTTFAGVVRNADPPPSAGREIEMGHYRATLDLALFEPDGSLRRVIEQRLPGEDRWRFARADGLGYSILPLVWGRRPLIDTHPGGFVLGTGDKWSLVRYDMEGNLFDTLAVDEDRIPVSGFHVDEYRRRRIAAVRAANGDHDGIRRTLAEYPFPSHFPAYWDVVASDGFTWVRQYTAPYPEPRNHWKVFGPDGALAATADLPGGFVLKWVGETHAAGVAMDELDTQRVELRPILR